MPHQISKAVIPAAGLGTRFLPATKVIPKEMMTLVDKPLLQYGVEELAASGITDIVLVTSRGKTAMEDHFDLSPELEVALEAKGKTDVLDVVRQLRSLARWVSVRQQQPLGLGHAVLQAKSVIGAQPFVVALPDDVFVCPVPCTRQLADIHEQTGHPVLALLRVPREKSAAYGIVDVEPVDGFDGRLFRIRKMIEKPTPEDAPADLAIMGRYVLTPDIFEALEKTAPGAIGEIQLTDGLNLLAQSRPFYGYLFEGIRYDAGDKFGYLQATVELALKHPSLGGRFREYLEHRSHRTSG